MAIRVDDLPALSWTGAEGDFRAWPGGFSLRSAAGVDWINHAWEGTTQHDATALVFDAPATFALSARVTVPGPRTTFDAGVLCVWASPQQWAKLCFEYSPQGVPMVVSVVTDGWSDDANATPIDGSSVWLRIGRSGDGWAFASSIDGVRWEFVRLFRFTPAAAVKVGFLAQSPTGDGATAEFGDVTLVLEAPGDARDGR